MIPYRALFGSSEVLDDFSQADVTQELRPMLSFISFYLFGYFDLLHFPITKG